MCVADTHVHCANPFCNLFLLGLYLLLDDVTPCVHDYELVYA